MSYPEQASTNRSTKLFPCASCGAKLEFAPGASTLKCPYCGHENKIMQSGEEVVELDFYEYFSRASEQGDSQEVQTVKCQSCGATSTVQPNISMSHCPFCGTQMHAQAKAARLIKPGALIPFKITRNKATQLFRDWLGGLWFAPNGLKEQASRDGGIKGLYIPYWTFDSKSTTWYDGERGENYHETQHYEEEDSNGNIVRRSRTVTHTRWYNVNGTVWQNFDDILVLAGRSLPPEMMEKLQTWDTRQLVPYQDEYMSGFQSEAYQIDLGDGFERAKKLMDEAIRKSVEKDIGGDHQRVNTVRTQFDGITFKHILLPAWISAYKYGGKSYRFIINGATGEVQGERPWSVAKIALTIIGAIIVLFLILMVLKK